MAARAAAAVIIAACDVDMAVDVMADDTEGEGEEEVEEAGCRNSVTDQIFGRVGVQGVVAVVVVVEVEEEEEEEEEEAIEEGGGSPASL